MRKVIFAALMAASTVPVSAAPIPRYDVESHCRATASPYRGYDIVYSGCLDSEQLAYDRLKEKWDAIPEAAAAACEKRESYPNSYNGLSYCLIEEMAPIQPTPSFKY